MYKLNFLTPEYKNRIKKEAKVRKYLGILVLVLLIQGGIFGILSLWNSNIENNIASKEQEIRLAEKEVAKIEKDMNEIPDLTNKIKVIEDVFSNEDFRISTVLNSLDDIAPLNVWFDKVTYDSGSIVITGASFENWELGLTSEENLYYFEKMLIESNLYESVTHEFTRKRGRGELKTNSFKFYLNLK